MRKTRRRLAVYLVATVAAVLALQPLVAREAPQRIEPTPSIRLAADAAPARGVTATAGQSAKPIPRNTAASRRPFRRSESLSTQLADKHAALPSVVMVRLDKSDARSLRAFADRYGIDRDDIRVGERSILTVKVPKGEDPRSFSKKLQKDDAVASASPDYFNKLAVYQAPDDPYYTDSQTIYAGTPSPDTTSYPYARSWWLRGFGANASAAWSHGFGTADYPVRASAASFKVGVIDTGFYMNHPDKGSNIVAGRDLCDTYTEATGVRAEDNDVTPANDPDAMGRSHGTCVAGQIAAATRNGTGVASIGYDAQVRVYKVAGVWTDADDYGYPAGSVIIPDSALIDAIYTAVDDGCKVISISLGSYDYLELEEEAIQYAQANGVVVVAATGNDAEWLPEHYGSPITLYPARYPGVIGVGAQDLDPDRNRVRASFSNYGEGLDVTAPGTTIWGLGDPSYDFGGGDPLYGVPGYTWWDGTSMATPAFAGALAHMWRYMPSFTATEISDFMLRKSIDAGPAGYDTTYGWGFLDMGGVMSGFMTDYAYLTKPTVSAPSATPSSTVTVSWTAVGGRSVSYDVAVDGSSVGSTTSTSKTVTLSAGTHTVKVTPKSSYNWWDSRGEATATIVVDGAMPSGGTLTVSSGASYTRELTVPVSAAVTDADEMRHSADGGSTWSTWAPYSASTTVTLKAGDGTKTVKAQYRNGSTPSVLTLSDTIILDTTAPSGTVALKGGASTTRSTTVAVTSNISGASQMRFRVDNGVWTSDWKAFASSSSIALGATQGTRTLTAEYKDAAGNTMTTTDPIKVLRPVTTSRLSGSNRYATSVAVSKSMYPGTVSTLVLASGQNYPDALCAAPLATAYGGPLLLTSKYSLDSAVVAEIKRLRPANVLIVGGTGVVSDKVKNAVAAMSWHPKVYRVWGSDRYRTAGAVAKWVAAKRKKSGLSVTKVVIANGSKYTDALLAAPMAAKKGWPILLVTPTVVPAGTSSAITSLKSYGLTSALVVGSTTNVSASAQKSLGVSSTSRVSGKDPYELSKAVADFALANGGTSSRIALATGLGYADALSSGPMLAANAGSSSFGVLLFSVSDATKPNNVPAAVSSWLTAHKSDEAVDKVIVIGGTGVLSDGNRDAVVKLLD